MAPHYIEGVSWVAIALPGAVAVFGLVPLVRSGRLGDLCWWGCGAVVLAALAGVYAGVLVAVKALLPITNATGLDYAVGSIYFLAVGGPIGAVAGAWVAVLLLGPLRTSPREA